MSPNNSETHYRSAKKSLNCSYCSLHTVVNVATVNKYLQCIWLILINYSVCDCNVLYSSTYDCRILDCSLMCCSLIDCGALH